MKTTLVAVGTRMPGWVEAGTAEYEKRIARDLGFTVREVAAAKRHKSGDTARYIQQESDNLLAQVNQGDFVVALEVEGKLISTVELAHALDQLRLDGQNLTLLVGGPDGLSDDCRKRANAQWSLSRMTLPHPLVRVIVAEQLYRAWSFLNDHPYHRE